MSRGFRSAWSTCVITSYSIHYTKLYERILFHSNRDGDNEVYSVALEDPADIVQLTDQDSDERYPAWQTRAIGPSWRSWRPWRSSPSGRGDTAAR